MNTLLRVKQTLSWLMALWISRVFLTSLTYKFTDAPETLHIFGIIGEWMQGIFGETLGSLFISYGAYSVGVVELIASILLLLPAVLWVLHKVGLYKKATCQAWFHSVGGLLSSIVMIGAVMFHLITPLGIEVLHNGESDGGSLFYAGVAIAVMGIVLFFLNGMKIRCTKKSV